MAAREIELGTRSQQHVRDEHEQQDEQTELLGAGHHLGDSL
jgi:hypothetical protein